MTAFSSIRMGAAALLASLSLVLSGCLLSPGKFTSELVLMGGNQFSFTYDGEISFLGLSQLADMGKVEAEFSAYCYDDEQFEQRDCTEAEIAEQRATWDESQQFRAAEDKRQAQQAAAMMGGIDLTDPAAADELVALLLRQKGWEKVEHAGDGLFKVRYSITGTMSHDFMFPVIEGMPPTNAFVQTFVRKNGQLRVNAPGFGGDATGGPLAAAFMGLSSEFGEVSGPGNENSNAPQIDGTFTIRTTGAMRILANNTDEGPVRTSTGEVLTWQITPRTKVFPTALIDLAS
jgi:hypothetical protein